MKIFEVIRNRFILFLIQTLILNLIVFYFGYHITLSFDIETSIEQIVIIQFLANYTLFDSLPSLIFIYLIWLIVSLIPIFLYINIKKSYSTNLLTFFFPNFFLYVFLSRFSPEYFNLNFPFHLMHTILLGVVIVVFSISLSLLIKRILKLKSKQRVEDLQKIVESGNRVCPKCGTIFESLPKYCYNCNTDLTSTIEDKIGKDKLEKNN